MGADCPCLKRRDEALGNWRPASNPQALTRIKWQHKNPDAATLFQNIMEAEKGPSEDYCPQYRSPHQLPSSFGEGNWMSTSTWDPTASQSHCRCSQIYKRSNLQIQETGGQLHVQRQPVPDLCRQPLYDSTLPKADVQKALLALKYITNGR